MILIASWLFRYYILPYRVPVENFQSVITWAPSCLLRIKRLSGRLEEGSYAVVMAFLLPHLYSAMCTIKELTCEPNPVSREKRKNPASQGAAAKSVLRSLSAREVPTRRSAPGLIMKVESPQALRDFQVHVTTLPSSTQPN